LEPLYKYLPSKYLDSFVGKGEVLFRSLSYYNSYEELEVRGDRNECRRVFTPSTGLELTKTTGEKILVHGTLESTASDREIFVFCTSKRLCPDLAKEFKADVCVEILEPGTLLSRVRMALKLRKRVKKGRLLHGAVDYYSPETPPLAEWAVPERIVMRKTTEYTYQDEYRLAFGEGNSLALENVVTRILTAPEDVIPTLDNHPKRILKVGSLRKLCRVHRFS